MKSPKTHWTLRELGHEVREAIRDERERCARWVELLLEERPLTAEQVRFTLAAIRAGDQR